MAKELKEAKAAKKEAERRCRQMEEEKEAICDDYEGRLQQQVCACVACCVMLVLFQGKRVGRCMRVEAFVSVLTLFSTLHCTGIFFFGSRSG